MFQRLTKKLTTVTCAGGLLVAMTVNAASAQEFRVESAGLDAVPTSYRARGRSDLLARFRQAPQAASNTRSFAATVKPARKVTLILRIGSEVSRNAAGLSATRV